MNTGLLIRKGIKQMPSLWMRLSAIITVSLFIAAYAMETGSAKPTLVEVWSGGDDGLTQRLKVAIEDAFKSSPDFTLSSGKKPGTFVVTIPTHVRWKQVGKRTKVFYTVEFASAENQNIGTRTGSCWDVPWRNVQLKSLRTQRSQLGEYIGSNGLSICISMKPGYRHL